MKIKLSYISFLIVCLSAIFPSSAKTGMDAKSSEARGVQKQQIQRVPMDRWWTFEVENQDGLRLLCCAPKSWKWEANGPGSVIERYAPVDSVWYGNYDYEETPEATPSYKVVRLPEKVTIKMQIDNVGNEIDTVVPVVGWGVATLPYTEELYIPSTMTMRLHAGVCEAYLRSLYTPMLRSIHVDENNPTMTSRDGVLYNKEMTVLGNCPPLKEGDFVVPSSVEVIDEHAFIGSRFKTIKFEHPSSLTSVKGNAFDFRRYCQKLTGSRLDHIIANELSDKAFVDSIVFPDNGKEIRLEFGAFSNSNVGYIYLSKSVRKLGRYSLDNGKAMVIEVGHESPSGFILTEYPFGYFDKPTDKVLIVPKGCKANWENVEPWKYMTIFEAGDYDSSSIEDVVVPEAKADVYNLQGICVMRGASGDDVSRLPSGVYIRNGRKFVVR